MSQYELIATMLTRAFRARLQPFLMWGGFFIGGLLVYRTILDGFFLSDDFALIAAVKSLGPFGLWAQRGSDLFRPLVSLIEYSDYRLWGLNPTGYHLTNLLFHASNAYLVCLIGARLLTCFGVSFSARRWAGPLAGVVFLVMPVHIESVTWIAGRTDLIATFFALLSFYYYLKSEQGTICFILSLVAFGFGLLAKESLLAFPLILVLLEGCAGLFAGRRRHALAVLRVGVCFGVVLLLYFGLRYVVVGQFLSTYGLRPIEWSLAGTRFWQAAARPIVPPNPALTDLFVQQGAPVMNNLGQGIVLVMCLVALVGLLRRSERQAALGLWIFVILAFIAALIPIFSLIGGYTIQTPSLDGRLLYLPSVFTAVLIALALGSLPHRVVGVMTLMLLSSYVYSLNWVNQNWEAASRITRSVLDSLNADPPNRPFLIMNLPDNLNGAYTFREGFSDAIQLLRPGFPNLEKVVTYFDLEREDNGFRIHFVEGDGSFRLEADNWQAYLHTRSGPTLRQNAIIDLPLYTLFSYDFNALSFIPRSTLPTYYYTQGKLIWAAP